LAIIDRRGRKKSRERSNSPRALSNELKDGAVGEENGCARGPKGIFALKGQRRAKRLRKRADCPLRKVSAPSVKRKRKQRKEKKIDYLPYRKARTRHNTHENTRERYWQPHHPTGKKKNRSLQWPGRGGFGIRECTAIAKNRSDRGNLRMGLGENAIAVPGNLGVLETSILGKGKGRRRGGDLLQLKKVSLVST